MDYSYKEMPEDPLFSSTAFEMPPFRQCKAPMRHERWESHSENLYTEPIEKGNIKAL